MPSRRRWQSSGGSLSLETKWRLAQKAFATTAAYDSAIASTLEQIGAPESDGAKFELGKATVFPQTLRLSFRKAFDLRYGENPHQKAALYSDGSGKGIANGKQLQGKELSYNNIVDLQAAWDLAQEFEKRCAPSSSTPTRAAQRLPTRWPKPISARWSAIRCRRSAA